MFLRHLNPDIIPRSEYDSAWSWATFNGHDDQWTDDDFQTFFDHQLL